MTRDLDALLLPMLAVQADGGKVHDSVVRTIGAWVLGGRYAPGETLPREEDLVAALGVSRTSVREAVKVLSAKGLVETRPRIGARIRPREHWRLLDPAVLSWHPNLTRDVELVTSLVEARRIIEPAAAELAARRGTAADLAVIEDAYLAMERSIPDDLAACCEADLAFHRGVIAASHNIVLNGLIGTMETALKAALLLTNSLMESQSRTLSLHKDVMECIRFRDTAGARAAMNRVLDQAAHDVGRM
ncbi:FadR/GntR family transcriptional regulator [Labrys wisconsinensis]|uniref:DNA-binding FadR family transcriptional regulator n=1 Tax=Labrys wisconsinensis TaxID=425677 RepID=A0ABU0JCE6_9HYPH|nr:FadR/GntR family transcriptional regulator [Labrys wisconsinensis]MDQ0471957.1 DNA-binding FadR family transcriptional regulator [Labrys wisconsinensis]